ncbi:type IX secretion system sortase PorU [Chitinophaga rhizophila]|uniref:Type IX secretion system sortase PorU n=1 Tax=Chitinophaga rhizophila TaxID=2866212 RepID=A0ABS7GFQ3_9BACT|nr:type IX secretion system sortase PorU [Chitinophaga rhizophila]MBW8686530.1 type IX secretion system sortase PorU [Chitinophaga rhizophila]
MKLTVFFCVLFAYCLPAIGANGRGGPYAAHSVLSKGSWFKLAVTREGIYKIDKALLAAAGVSGAPANVRLYGAGGRMLPEANAASRHDDLPEVALIEEGDYLLFYAPGPHSWQYQGGNFTHTANLYADTAWYFLTTDNGTGKRAITDPTTPAASLLVNSFDYRTFYENDSLNFLNSGKQWWGTVFNSARPQHTINFTLPLLPQSVKVGVRVAARSNGTSRFSIQAGSGMIGSIGLSPVSGNIFEAFAAIGVGYYNTAPSGTTLPVTLTFTPGGGGAQGWLDYLTLQARCRLQLPSGQPLFFRDMATVLPGQTAQYRIENADSQTTIMDITDPLQPVKVQTRLTGNTVTFSRDCGTLHEYAALNGQGYLQPVPAGKVANQDLHGLSGADMLIVTIPGLQSAADKLAAWHSMQDKLNVKVVTVNEIYNEFGSGTPDPTAIRDFVKMCYDRGGLQYLLLFGDASYDYKNRIAGNTNLVPTWQSAISNDPVNAYPSDDFFGFLDDADDINDNSRINQLDIAIGRLPVQTLSQAEAVVKKIIGYNVPANYGRWQQHITIVADDGDDNLHLQDAEHMSEIVGGQWPAGNIKKIYLDAYPKVADAGGSRYPAVNKAIAEDIFEGTLIWNYTGHGSYSRLAEEVIMEQSSLATWKNTGKLPLFITATCDFAPFDNPAYVSLGEQLLLQEQGGGIALMTTTRAVFSASNKVMNANYLQKLLTPAADGRMPTLGQAAMQAKNLTYATYIDIPNNRKFQLLGDPALTLAFPQYHVVTDSINGKAAGDVPDTLKAMGRYTVKGHLEDAQGVRQDNYKGTLYTTVYDKPALQYTMGNDAGSTKAAYYQQQHMLYRGQQTIQDGQFTCTFVVPADIDYQTGAGVLSFYAANSIIAAGGVYSGVQIGGTADDVEQDASGPVIQAYLDNEYFRNGGLTGENPVLLLHLKDEQGINTSGYGIGHDLIATLDNDKEQYYILNNFFEAVTDSYQEGKVRFPLYALAEGSHTMTIKAWDTHNNAGTATLQFRVIKSSGMTIGKAGCFPNPFHHQTQFTFEHNQQDQALEVMVQIYTVTGQQIKTIRHTINSGGSRYVGAPWDGTNDSGSRVPPGMYIYNILVTANGKKTILGGKVTVF